MKRVQPEPGRVGAPHEVLRNDGRGGVGQVRAGGLRCPEVGVLTVDTADDVVIALSSCEGDRDMTRMRGHQDDWAARSPLDVNLHTLQGLLSLHSSEGDQP